MIRCDSFSRSQQGLSHSANHDSLLDDAASSLYVVADGVSGRPGGALASQIAVDEFARLLRPALVQGELDDDLIVSALHAADHRIQALKVDPVNSHMATTLSALLLCGQNAHIAHVGDSRIYRFRAGELTCLTEDQTVGAELVRRGHIQADELERHPLRNMLTQSLGNGDLDETQVLTSQLELGDLYLLTSDGLTEIMPDETLHQLLLEHKDQPVSIVGNELFSQAAAAKPADDLTIILVRLEMLNKEKASE